MLSSSQTHAVIPRAAAHADPPAGASAPFTLVLLIESASFFVAALVHAGTLAPPHPVVGARILELSIGTLLLLGAVGSWFAPARAPSIGFGAQAAALLATSLGLVAIAAGLPGPLYTYHLVFNAGVLLLLHLGLVLVSQTH